MTTTVVTDDGAELIVKAGKGGDRPVLMMCNSLGTDHRMWDGQVAAFGDTYRIVRYDRRGHGSSAVPPGPYTIERLGRDVLAILDGLGIDMAWFCGLSLGGMTGMWLAANAPERFYGVALCNTSAHMPAFDMWNERIAVVRDGRLHEITTGVLERWFTADFRASNPDDVTRVRDQFVVTPGEGYAACCEAIRDMDQRDLLANITVPTLVITGSDDPATIPAAGRLIAESIPGARYVEIEGAAHLSNIEKPEAFNAALASFLSA